MPRTDVSTPTTGAWTDADSKSLLVERIFSAPRALVFQAFTDADRLEQWWGPRQWPATVKKLDLKPGGVWHYCMTGPDGTKAWGKAVYKEIVPIEKIVYIDSFSDADGNDNPDLPASLITFNFIDLGDGRTKLTSTAEYASVEDLNRVAEMGMVSGLSESLDRLEELLAG